MTVELTQEISSRLTSDHYGWLTTVAKSGQPIPRLVWFYFDGANLTVYSMPQAGKVAHINDGLLQHSADDHSDQGLDHPTG